MQATATLALKPGDVLEGGYVLRERIGHGGMGDVFLADWLATGRTVAIKALRPQLADWPTRSGQMRHEAEAARRVHSPHCVAVIEDRVPSHGMPYLVMEHVPGRSLGQLITDESLPLARVIELFDQVLAAIGAAHASGVIHGDVKSDNLLVEHTAGTDRVTLIDFGLARIDGAPTRVDVEDGEVMVSGTPEYMAPEVIRGAPPVRASDLYSAGVILYELLTGTTPFRGGSALQIMVRHAHDAVLPPSLRAPDRDIPRAVDRVVLRALDKHPEARFPDAETFARELRAAAVASRPVADRSALPDQRWTQELPTLIHAAPLPRERIARGSERCGAGHP